MAGLLERLAERVLVWDGGMGTQFQAANLDLEDFRLRSGLTAVADELASKQDSPILEGCNEILNLTRPDVVRAVHDRYLAAGSDLIETNTFGSSTVALGEYDIPELLWDISLAAAQIARQAADAASTPDRPRFAVGAIGPGTKLVSLGQVSFEAIRDSYRTAYLALLQGGVDALLLETLQDLLMAKAALVGAHEAIAEFGRDVPIFAQVTMEQTGTMLLGSEIGAALNFFECFPAVKAIGMNCATGPTEMMPHLRFLGQHSTRPLTVQPNAGLPIMEKGHAVYKLTPDELAQKHLQFIEEFGVAMVGGCCGTTPDHIKAVADLVGGKEHVADCHWRRVRHLFPGFDFEMNSDERAGGLALVGCSSLYQFQPYRQDQSFLIVGERTNANGSKAFRDMLAAENWEGLTELAREQEGEGSHVLDVCAAYVGRNEKRDMEILLSYYNRQITVPVMIDSTEVDVIEASLQSLAGKPIVNSINFEDGEARTDKVLALCKRYGAAIVALTIDEKGMAKTAEEKVAIAERILGKTRAAGIPDHDVFIDCLTFTLGSGDEEFRASGMETIDAIETLMKRHPRLNAILGVSNVSFGLKPAARIILNSVFLTRAREAGLTSAIVHFSKIKPEHQIDGEIWKIADDLVYDRREFALS